MARQRHSFAINTSLPSPGNCGDLGVAALSFIDFLASAEQGVWQMLPVGPAGYGDSPYSAQSAFAGNPLLIAVDDGEENATPATQRGGARAPSAAIDYARASRRSRLGFGTCPSVGQREPLHVAGVADRHVLFLGAELDLRALARGISIRPSRDRRRSRASPRCSSGSSARRTRSAKGRSLPRAGRSRIHSLCARPPRRRGGNAAARSRYSSG